ncbi:MAG: aspartate dehydrogenase [Clostridia bacterium]|nr:aspartate dehydrogenase [Clostridia bacterium]MBR0435675.1 aspartate dehydrogenase [Clostridia bacterium]
MFGRKKKPLKRYDAETEQPVLRKSICTGETTAGFRNLQTGRFFEVMLIRTPRDLDEFMETYGIEEIPKTEY